jgi:hypothetical protein
MVWVKKEREGTSPQKKGDFWEEARLSIGLGIVV